MTRTCPSVSGIAVLAIAASVSAAQALDKHALREELRVWLTRPGITGLLHGPFVEDDRQMAASREAKKLPPEGAPIAVGLLESATTINEKIGAICLVSFYLREHPVAYSLKARARRAVVAELNRRPLKGTGATIFCIKFLGDHGAISDLKTIEPYIVHGYIYEVTGQGAWESILKRAGRTSPPLPFKGNGLK